MITEEQEREILRKAYVPEQIVGLMRILSGGEPFLIHDFLCLAGEGWLIVIGYPLEGDFRTGPLEKALREAVGRFRPVHLWFAAPEVPPSFSASCSERESDFYYLLDLQSLSVNRALMRAVQRASKELTVERSTGMSREHEALIREFLRRQGPGPRVRELFLAMPRYVSRSSGCTVLSAWDHEGRLAAMYVVELSAESFATYLVGCHSREHYVPHASDLLFYEMILLAKGHAKRAINLGLGVNQGIRRFKEKWGGVPWLRYEFCGCTSPKGRLLQMLESFWARRSRGA